MNRLILGSNSPRRKEILTNLGFDFEVRTTDADEILPDGFDILRAAEYLAIQKGQFIQRNSEEILLTADTVVINDNQILGKPKTKEIAADMLHNLSDRTHEVISGVSIQSDDISHSFSISTSVRFRKLLDHEIEYYVKAYSPMDKAGAYGIQEWIGQVAIESITGSYFNVVGLPTTEVYLALTERFGISIR